MYTMAKLYRIQLLHKWIVDHQIISAPVLAPVSCKVAWRYKGGNPSSCHQMGPPAPLKGHIPEHLIEYCHKSDDEDLFLTEHKKNLCRWNLNPLKCIDFWSTTSYFCHVLNDNSVHNLYHGAFFVFPFSWLMLVIMMLLKRVGTWRVHNPHNWDLLSDGEIVGFYSIQQQQ